MLEKRIIPCLDVRDGKVVKGVNFEGIKEVGDPVNFAKNYIAQGADELVLYDILASVEKRIVSLDLVKCISKNSHIPLCVAGGIGIINDFARVIDAGAKKVSMNSLAIKNPKIIRQAVDKFGKESIVIGIDAKRVDKGFYTVMTSAGKLDTGLDLMEWVKEIESLGANEICLNSIDADGKKTGYDIEMLNAVCEVTKMQIIASGGCGKLEHFSEVFKKTSASAALAASVFHFGELTVGQIKEHLKKEGIQ